MLFCPIPWIHQAVRNNGDFRVCCQANPGPDQGMLRKDDGTVYNAGVDDLNEVRNCQKLKDIRYAMLNDKWHPDCIRCEREEKSGIRSRFTFEKDAWNHIYPAERALKVTNCDGSIDVKTSPIMYYDLRFGNKCNLKCRMCGPSDSDLWYEDYMKLWNTDYYVEPRGKINIVKLNGKYVADNDMYNWHESQSFWNQLDANMKNARLIQTVGGEPMLIKQLFDFLERCISMGESKHISIEHNSNIVYIPEKAWDIWKKFRVVRIGASIDGIKKVDEYIRFPSHWETIEKNIHRLDNAEGKFNLWITHSVQMLNVLYLPEFLEWKIKQNFKRVNVSKNRLLINDHPVHRPKFMAIKVLPYEAKLKVKEHYNNFKFEKYNELAHKLLDKYVDFMFAEDNSHLLPKFWMYNNKLDELRCQSMKESLPELYKLIGDTNV